MFEVYTTLILIALGYIFIIYRRGDLDKDIDVIKRISNGLLIGVKKLWLIRPSVNTSNVSDKFKRYLSIFFNLSIFILIILFISFLVLFVFSIVTVFLFYRYLKRLILNIELNKPKKLITKFFVTLIKFGISFIFVFFAIYFLLDADKYFFGHKNLFSNYNYEKGKVDRIIDGDTIVLVDGRKIRYLAVDTPEKDDCFFKESTNRNKQLVSGKNVLLYKGNQDKDTYDRYLRYVVVEDSKIFVNQELLRYGFGGIDERYEYQQIPEIYKYLKDSQRKAKDELLGGWGKCSY